MDDIHCLKYRDTGYFSTLICDYLDQKPELQEFYNRFPTLPNFKDQISEKSQFPDSIRKVLSDTLSLQYQKLNSPGRDTELVLKNIESLRNPKTFTVTTGHQLNIFTGPLYFLYKIISTINLSKQLKAAYPGFNFVPVYWMATEDHDFAEINFINLGEKISWQRDKGGPVGRMSTKSMSAVIQQLENNLGAGSHAKYLIEIFKNSYLEHGNLADATRYLVHQLFGDEGLLILDGDDPQLKRIMLPFFEKDLFENSPHRAVAKTTSQLEEKYFDQVHPREINLFYIKDGLRERIEKQGETWKILNTDLQFSESALRQELEQHPERFSPNVVLRPLYQEIILPNLAYIGGGGELAYWFQLQGMFATMKVAFPMLVLRNSVLWIGKKEQRKIAQMDISIKDLFQPLHQLKKQFVSQNAPMDVELDPYDIKLRKMFDELEDVAKLTDKSMLGAVNAQRQKQLNGLENLRKKLIRAEKRRQDDGMKKLESVYFSLFPKGSLQERHDNFSTYHCEYGQSFTDKLKEVLDPLDFKFTVIKA